MVATDCDCWDTTWGDTVALPEILNKKVDGNIILELVRQAPGALIAVFMVYWLTQTIYQSMRVMQMSVDQLAMKITDNSVTLRENSRLLVENNRYVVENNLLLGGGLDIVTKPRRGAPR